jgi:hypothetical protein
MSRWGNKYVVPFFAVLVLSSCAKPVTQPHLTPAPVAGLVLGMTLEEAEKFTGPCLYTPVTIVHNDGKIIDRLDYLLFKTEQDRLKGKETSYRLYFLYEEAPPGKPPHMGPKFFKLVHWSEEGNWEKDEAILKKTRFK